MVLHSFDRRFQSSTFPLSICLPGASRWLASAKAALGHTCIKYTLKFCNETKHGGTYLWPLHSRGWGKNTPGSKSARTTCLVRLFKKNTENSQTNKQNPQNMPGTSLILVLRGRSKQISTFKASVVYTAYSRSVREKSRKRPRTYKIPKAHNSKMI